MSAAILGSIVAVNQQYRVNLDAIKAKQEHRCATCGRVMVVRWNERCQWIDVTPCACSGKGEVK